MSQGSTTVRPPDPLVEQAQEGDRLLPILVIESTFGEVDDLADPFARPADNPINVLLPPEDAHPS